MVLAGAKIYHDGIGFGHEAEEKILQIVKAIKTVSPSSDISMRFFKSDGLYEGLLWGKTSSFPIGIYRRGASLNQVLENLYKRVKRDCLTKWKRTGTHSGGSKSDFNSNSDLLMAS